MGANVDLEFYDKKWTNHPKYGFSPTKANPCVMMREDLKTKFCEYIAVYVNDLYIASQSPEDIVNTLKTKCKLKIKTNINYLMIQVE